MDNIIYITKKVQQKINSKFLLYFLISALIAVIYPFNTVILLTLLCLALFSKKTCTSTQSTMYFFAVVIFILFSFLKINSTNNKLSKIEYLNRIQINQVYKLYFLEPCATYNTYVSASILETDTKVLVYISPEFTTLPKYGDIYTVTHKRTNNQIPRNPGQEKSKFIELSKSYAGRISIKQAQFIEKGEVCPIKSQAYFLRHCISSFYQKLPLPKESALLSSLIIGNKTVKLPKRINVAYKKLGLTHLLVVSGSQVALLSTLFFTILGKFIKKRGLLLGLIFLFQALFYFITGGGISLFRAILFNSLCLINKSISTDLNKTHLISLTSLALLAIDPFMIFDIAAQLSFAATLSLLYGVPALTKAWPDFISKEKREFLSLLLAPFLLTSPILWFHFYTISPISLLSNALFMILVEFLVVIGFITTILGLFGLPFTTLILTGLLIIIKGANSIIFKLSDIPYATLSIAPPPLYIIIILYMFFALSIFALQNNAKNLKSYCKSTLILLISWSIFYVAIPNRYYTITFIDVGQGDSALISTPKKAHILIDTGGIIKGRNTTKIQAEYNILPVLKYYSINLLHMIFISHYDMDHSGGLKLLKKTLPINTIYDNGNPQETTFRQKQIRKSANITLGENAAITQLYPSIYNRGESKNDNSIVLKLDIKNISFLFTGDIEYNMEQKLVLNEGTNLKTTVLKASHHGSKTSSSAQFINVAEPLITVISCSLNNRYGHPNKGVIERLKKKNSIVLRTDQSGAILFKTDGKKLYYKTII
jgi:competence protein ComEC